MENNNIDKSEVLDCLTRSGYLLESRLVSTLSKSGFFIDPNQVIKDEFTGKPREIDIIAEYYNHNVNNDKTSVKTHFIIEAINNLYPLILTTERPFSPNNDTGIKYWATPNEEPFGDVNVWEGKDPDEEEITVFTQYCAITKKRNKELMASHPDDLYSSINKMIQYCSSSLSYWYERNLKDEYWRVWFWQPVLVLQNELMRLVEKDNGEYVLVDIPFGKLEFNYHTEGEPDSIFIDIVTEKYFLDHLMETVQADGAIENNLANYRNEKST